jgi:hypothetical protein
MEEKLDQHNVQLAQVRAIPAESHVTALLGLQWLY